MKPASKTWKFVGAAVLCAAIVSLACLYKGFHSKKSGYIATSSADQPNSQNPIAETAGSDTTTDNGNDRFTSQDRADMRNGRTPSAIVILAKRAGIDETTLTSIINEKRSEIQQQGDPSGLLLNDGQQFWNMIYDSLMKTIVQGELTK